MMIPGKIVITDKVNFEPDGLIKPNWDILSACFIKHGCDAEDIKGLYNEKMKDYEASKQLVEVSNVFWGELSECWFYDDEIGCEVNYKVINNQPCKAEVIKNKATIIELINRK